MKNAVMRSSGSEDSVIESPGDGCTECMPVSASDYWEKSFIAGSAKLYVLSVLSEGPQHGYGILKEISDRSENCCSISAGTIYPILRVLEKEGLVTSVKDLVGGRARVTYEITQSGREVLKKGLNKWEAHVLGAKKILRV